MEKTDYSQDFLLFKNKLHSFIFRLLTNRQDAEDVMQETYLKVHQHIGSFKGKSSFKTWTFAIAVNLAPNQQICLLLKEVYAFTVTEIMQITGLSEGVVKHAIANARKNMIRIFNGRCSFVSKKGTCHQCTALKGIFNPEQNAHIEALKVEMVKQGSHPDKPHLLHLRLDIMKDIDPLNAPNSKVNIFMLENNERWVEEAKAKKLL